MRYIKYGLVVLVALSLMKVTAQETNPIVYYFNDGGIHFIVETPSNAVVIRYNKIRNNQHVELYRDDQPFLDMLRVPEDLGPETGDTIFDHQRFDRYYVVYEDAEGVRYTLGPVEAIKAFEPTATPTRTPTLTRTPTVTPTRTPVSIRYLPVIVNNAPLNK